MSGTDYFIEWFSNMTETANPNQPEENRRAEQPQNWQPPKRRGSTVLFALCIAAGTAAALYAWNLPPFKGSTVSTDNAYVRGQTTLVSPRVGGYVTEVLVRDFQQVKKGDPLVRIDDQPYLARVAQAEANLAAQNAQLGKVGQNRTSAQANRQARQTALRNAEIQLTIARTTMSRMNSVKNSQGIAKHEYDQARAALEQAEAAHAAAQAQYTVARQDILGVQTGKQSADAAVEGARAALDLAKQDLAHTVIYAPADGRLGEVAVKTGQLVSAGTQMMFVVPPKHWIIANFTEADTANIRIGQSAEIKVDALAGKTFSGRVSEIAPATAAEFSVIRADGGTGNFVKIAQRIPVKIELDAGQQESARLAPGMSVEAAVDTAPKEAGR